MNVLFRFLLFWFDPLKLWRTYLIYPILNRLSKLYNNFRTRTGARITSLRELIMRFGALWLLGSLIVWLAVFLYLAFFYVYMPAITHTRPVYMQFKTSPESVVPYTFPHAHISLTKKQDLLMVGQAYQVIIKIDMPESPQNIDLGMFMVCTELRSNGSQLCEHSCRSAMMRYRSPLIRLISTWVLSPLYVLGLKEEFQEVHVEVFSRYVERHQQPTTDVYVEIQSHKIQFYAVSLNIHADFTGLRYLMYNWPIITALIAITTNLFLIVFICLLSWYQWTEKGWLYRTQKRFGELTIVAYNGINNMLAMLPDSIDFGDEKLPAHDVVKNVGAMSSSELVPFVDVKDADIDDQTIEVFL